MAYSPESFILVAAEVVAVKKARVKERMNRMKLRIKFFYITYNFLWFIDNLKDLKILFFDIAGF